MPSVTLTVTSKVDAANRTTFCVRASPAVVNAKVPQDKEIEVIAPETNTRDITVRWDGDELAKAPTLFAETPENGVKLKPGKSIKFKLKDVKGVHDFGLKTTPGSCDGHHHDIFHVEGC